MSIEWLAFQLMEKLVTLKNTRLSKEDLDHKTCQVLVACINEIGRYIQTEYECDPEDIDMEDYVCI